MAGSLIDLAAAFCEADTDKSGTLDKEQFKNVLSVVSSPPNQPGALEE
jgi:hypothetical protein